MARRDGSLTVLIGLSLRLATARLRFAIGPHTTGIRLTIRSHSARIRPAYQQTLDGYLGVGAETNTTYTRAYVQGMFMGMRAAGTITAAAVHDENVLTQLYAQYHDAAGTMWTLPYGQTQTVSVVTNQTVTKIFTSPEGRQVTTEVELFTWEKLDYVEKVKHAFGL